MKDIKKLKTQLDSYDSLKKSTKKEIEKELDIFVEALNEIEFFDKFKIVEEDRGYTNNDVFQFKDCKFENAYNCEKYKIIPLKHILDKKKEYYAHFHVDSESIYHGVEGYVVSVVSKLDGIWLTLHREFEHDGEILMNVLEKKRDNSFDGRKLVSPLFNIKYEHANSIDDFKKSALKVINENELELIEFELKLNKKLQEDIEIKKQKDLKDKREKFNKLKKELGED